MRGFLIIMATVALMAIGAAIYFKPKTCIQLFYNEYKYINYNMLPHHKDFLVVPK